MDGIIDFHTHAFPDKLAAAAVPFLEKEGNVKAFLDGTVSGLLASMERAGITTSVVCSIATRPSQFEAILSWSRQVRSDRIEPFLSVHPDSKKMVSEVERVRQEGFKGIKMHPYYQKFFLDEERLFPFYEAVSNNNLILVMHTGFDIAYPRIRLADPPRIARVLDRFPKLKLVATHMGAWEQWREVEEILLGRELYLDISYSLDFMDQSTAVRLLNRHPSDYILFGSDSPWADQQPAVQCIKKLDISDELQQKILFENGRALLEL
jgi:predicted TIM-barrel fold metal-dependent hydrolase